MRIPLHLEVVCKASPHEVMERIRRAGEWRESAMPADLKQQGLLSLEVTVDGSTFSLRYFQTQRRDWLVPRLSGRVDTHSGGAVVVARGGISRLAWLPAGLFVLAAANNFRIGATDMPLLVLAIVAVGVTTRVYFWLGQEASKVLLFIKTRLDGALADVEVQRKEYARRLG